MRGLLAGGAGLVVLYTMLITLSDAITKALATGYPAAQLYAVSGAVVVALCLICAPFQAAPVAQPLRTRCPRAMALRAAATIAATCFFFLAFRHLPFAEVFLFIGLMPLFAALMAGPVLGERVTPAAWGALWASLLGVICLFPQGLHDIGAGHAFALLAALSGTLSIVISRRIGRVESNGLAQVFWPNLALMAVMAAALPFVRVPMPLADIALAAAYGAALFAARWLLVTAVRRLPAHAVTSLMKLQFVWMVLVGALAFGEWPAGTTYAGTAIVIASGLFLAYEAPLRAWALARRRGQPA